MEHNYDQFTDYTVFVKKYSTYLKLLIGAAILLCLASCHVTKDIHKTSTTTDTTAEVKTAISQTITETIDTLIAITGQTLTGIKAIDQLQAGDSIFEETPELEIITKIDKGRVKTTAIKRAIMIPVKQNRTTFTHLDRDARSEVKVKVDAQYLHKSWRSGINWNWLWVLLAGVIVLEAWHLGWFKRRDDTPS